MGRFCSSQKSLKALTEQEYARKLKAYVCIIKYVMFLILKRGSSLDRKLIYIISEQGCTKYFFSNRYVPLSLFRTF